MPESETNMSFKALKCIFCVKDFYIDTSINKIKRTTMWIAMTFIMLLFFLSIYGAFIGSERAKAFFNSVPMAIYWIAFIFLLLAGIALFPD